MNKMNDESWSLDELGKINVDLQTQILALIDICYNNVLSEQQRIDLFDEKSLEEIEVRKEF